MKTRLLIIIGITMTVITISTQDAFACQCATPIDDDLALEESEYAYIGIVTDISKQHGRQIVIFDVEHVLKGNVNQTHILDEVDLHEISCGMDYDVGSIYKVYQYKSQAEINDGIGEWTGTAERMEPEPSMPDVKTSFCTTEEIFRAYPSSPQIFGIDFTIVFAFLGVVAIAFTIYMIREHITNKKID